ncbi:hypothetical protein [Simkania sp.]|uniref:hypothetical protein n=1 Tax=Simkania sp. TaxID=34094 RepID=UPI003B51E9B5
MSDFRIKSSDGTHRSHEAGKSDKAKGAKLDDAGYATKEKIVAFLDVHYQPVTKWESDKTFEEVLQKTLGRQIAPQTPTQESEQSTKVANNYMVGG